MFLLGKAPEKLKNFKKLAPKNESDNNQDIYYIESLGAKPPKIFEISSEFASKNESDNKGK